MENFDSLICERENTIAALRRIEDRISVNMENIEEDVTLLEDIASQCKQISNEGLDRDSFSRAFNAIKSTAATAITDASNFVAKVAAVMDSTGKKDLDLIRKKINSVDGDLPTSEVVIVNKGLAEVLHVGGRVPDDPMSSLNKTLMMSSYIRTTVLPSMSNGLNKVWDDLNTENYAVISLDETEKALTHSLQVKSLLDFFKSPDDLFAQFPGGYTLCHKEDSAVPAIGKPDSANAKALAGKTKALYASGVVLNQKVSSRRAKASAYQVPLLSRDEAQQALNVIAKVIGEADGLLKTAKALKEITSSSIRMACKYHAAMEDYDNSDNPEKKVANLDLMAVYYKHSLLSHDVLLTTIAAIMHKAAKAYLQLVTTSINHYR